MLARSRRFVALALALAGLALIGTTISAQPVSFQCENASPPCLALANLFIRADMGPAGTWALGTTGGDPDTPLDDNKTLVYGFKPGNSSDVGSSWTTVRIIGPGGSRDVMPAATDTVNQEQVGDALLTTWAWQEPHQVRVTQTLRLIENPFSGRPDAVGLRYEVHNDDRVEVRIGIRSLVDVKLGLNDGAPYLVPGIGAIVTEREFLAPDVPPFWVAFESPTYDPRELRAVGMLRSPDLSTPDRFVLAFWHRIRDHNWDYAIDATQPITKDSTVVLYWQPRPVAPGARYEIAALHYGVAGNRGGQVFLSGPQAVCGQTVPVSLFVSNFQTEPLTDGSATLSLPAGLALAPGETATKALGTIPAGGTGTVVWQVAVGPTASGTFSLSATVTFDTGPALEARHELRVTCDLPTTTPSPTPPRPTATPTVIATADANQPTVCAFLLGRVPPAAIAVAVASPHRVRGWNELANPAEPPSPFNLRRRMLSIQNIGRPYHPAFNDLVYKVGCP